MAEQNVKITFEIDGLSQSVSSVEELQNALKGVDTQAKKTETQLDETASAAKSVGDESKAAGEAGEGAMKVLDEVTGGLATKVKEVGGGMKAMGKQAITAFKGAVQGAGAMGKALIATGIGAIVVALGLIVAYWDDIVGAISGVSADQKQLLADTEAEVGARQASLDATLASENSLRLAGKSEKEIRDLKIQQTDEAILALENQLTLQKEQSDAQVKALQRNKNIAEAVIGFLMSPVTLLLGAVDALTAGLAQIGVLDEGTSFMRDFTGGLAGMLFDPEEAKEEGDKTATEIEDQLRKMKNTRDGYIITGQKEDADAAQKRSDDAKAAGEKAAEEEKKRLEELAALKAAIREAEANTEAELRAKSLEDLDIYYADLIAKATEQGINTQELETSQLEAQAALKQKYADEDIARAEQAAAEQKTIDEKAAADAQLILDARIAGQVGFANAVGGAIGAVGDLFEEGTAAAKTAALAEIAIGTGVGFIQALDIAQKSAKATGPGAAFAFPIFYATQIAAVLSAAGQAKKILQTTKGGGGSAGASVTAPTIPGAPAYDPTQALSAATGSQTGDNQITLGQQQGSSGATIVKAYVVSSDMTKQQEADKKINDLARL